MSCSVQLVALYSCVCDVIAVNIESVWKYQWCSDTGLFITDFNVHFGSHSFAFFVVSVFVDLKQSAVIRVCV